MVVHWVLRNTDRSSRGFGGDRHRESRDQFLRQDAWLRPHRRTLACHADTSHSDVHAGCRESVADDPMRSHAKIFVLGARLGGCLGRRRRRQYELIRDKGGDVFREEMKASWIPQVIFLGSTSCVCRAAGRSGCPPRGPSEEGMKVVSMR